MKYNHVGIPTADAFEGEIPLPHLKEPNRPSRGVLVAFVEIQGAPVELMQIDHQGRPDL